MPRTTLPLRALILGAALAAGGCGAGSADPAGRLSFGYGEVDITPPAGTILGGFGFPGGLRRVEGVNDPLLAQAALFTSDTGAAFLVISMDVAGYFYDFGDWGPGLADLRRSIAAALAPGVTLEPEHILIAASHSHAATDLTGFWQEYGQGVPVELLDWHIERVTAAAVAAAADLGEAELYHGATELVGYTGRDKGCSEVLDDTVAVLQARKAGAPAVTLVNYAKHTNLLPDENHIASADFVWGLREELGASTGAPVMYLNGFIAAVQRGPKMSEVPGDDIFAVTYNMGKILAEAVAAILPDLTAATHHDIRHRSTTFRCAVEGDYATTLYELLHMLRRYVTEEGEQVFVDVIEASWHQLGPVEFAVFPGEGTPETSLELRARMASPGQFVVGLGNDSLGYIVDPVSLANDPTGQLMEYEVQMGLGLPAYDCVWGAMASLGWFDGGFAAAD